LFEKAFRFGDDDRRIAIEKTDPDGVLSHDLNGQQSQR
jgi:hypothetical protein